jgi:hypothetical protein
MAIPDVQTSHDFADILAVVAFVPMDRKGHGNPEVVAFHAPVHQAVNLQDSQGLRVDQKSQILREVGSSPMRGEIDHHHLPPLVLLQKQEELDDPSIRPLLPDIVSGVSGQTRGPHLPVVDLEVAELVLM